MAHLYLLRELRAPRNAHHPRRHKPVSKPEKHPRQKPFSTPANALFFSPEQRRRFHPSPKHLIASNRTALWLRGVYRASAGGKDGHSLFGSSDRRRFLPRPLRPTVQPQHKSAWPPAPPHAREQCLQMYSYPQSQLRRGLMWTIAQQVPTHEKLL